MTHDVSGVGADLTRVTLVVNGDSRSVLVEPRTLLVDVLRYGLGLTGTHVGCEHGVCGACTVRINGEIARSCIMFAVQADGAAIETIEGLAHAGQLHVIQEAFHVTHGLQCGFCTPGLVLATEALLDEFASPSDAEIRAYLSGNICRCTGYTTIVQAVREAARRLSEPGDGVGSYDMRSVEK